MNRPADAQRAGARLVLAHRGGGGPVGQHDARGVVVGIRPPRGGAVAVGEQQLAEFRLGRRLGQDAALAVRDPAEAAAANAEGHAISETSRCAKRREACGCAGRRVCDGGGEGGGPAERRVERRFWGETTTGWMNSRFGLLGIALSHLALRAVVAEGRMNTRFGLLGIALSHLALRAVLACGAPRRAFGAPAARSARLRRALRAPPVEKIANFRAPLESFLSFRRRRAPAARK